MAELSCFPDREPTSTDRLPPSPEFRRAVRHVCLRVASFFAVYVAMLVLCGGGLGAVVFLAIEEGASLTTGLALVGALPAAVVLVDLLRSLAHQDNSPATGRLEITELDQPRLFAFLRALCERIGVPMPRHVYVESGVNASAILDASARLPGLASGNVSLSIGLGLVNILNLSEFTAILAHEVAHISHLDRLQRWIHHARRISRCIQFDDPLGPGVTEGLRRSVPGRWLVWVVDGMVWLPRKILMRMWSRVFRIDRELSRQQELHADAVAVRVAGSDAMVLALRRCDCGADALRRAMNALKDIHHEGGVTRDLYIHQAAFLNTDQDLSEGATVTITPRPDEHASLKEREANARHQDVRIAIDARSAWILFDEVARLRERVTREYYVRLGRWRGDDASRASEIIQALIDESKNRNAIPARYRRLYAGRPLFVADFTDIVASAERGVRCETIELCPTVAEVDEAKSRAEAYRRCQAVLHGASLTPDEAMCLGGGEALDLDQVASELRDHQSWLEKFDAQVCQAYLTIAGRLGPAEVDELRRQYEFLLAVQSLLDCLQALRPSVQSVCRSLNQRRSQDAWSPSEERVREALSACYKGMNLVLTRWKELESSIGSDASLAAAFVKPLTRKDVTAIGDRADTVVWERWALRLIRQFGEMSENLQKQHQFGMKRILEIQERLIAEDREKPDSSGTVHMI